MRRQQRPTRKVEKKNKLKKKLINILRNRKKKLFKVADPLEIFFCLSKLKTPWKLFFISKLQTPWKFFFCQSCKPIGNSFMRQCCKPLGYYFFVCQCCKPHGLFFISKLQTPWKKIFFFHFFMTFRKTFVYN